MKADFWFLLVCCLEREILVVGGGIEGNIPTVPRPPIFILPNRQKGVEKVTMVLGTISRMTMTLDGSEGMSLEVMVK